MDTLNKLAILEQEASKFGFKWENAEQILTQIKSECSEVEIHLKDQDKTKLQEEIGDLMHAIFSLCIFCKLDPNITLEKAVAKFEHRFKALQKISKEQGLTTLSGKSFDELMKLWEKAKAFKP